MFKPANKPHQVTIKVPKSKQSMKSWTGVFLDHQSSQKKRVNKIRCCIDIISFL